MRKEDGSEKSGSERRELKKSIEEASAITMTTTAPAGLCSCNNWSCICCLLTAVRAGVHATVAAVKETADAVRKQMHCSLITAAPGASASTPENENALVFAAAKTNASGIYAGAIATAVIALEKIVHLK